jgi:hypothetical protein
MIEMIKQFIWEWGIGVFFPICAVLAISLLFLIVLLLINTIYESILHHKRTNKNYILKQSYITEVNYMKNYCSDELVVGKICDRLLEVLDDGCVCPGEMYKWREDLRKEFKNK